jgi:hypothetical protein
VQDAEGFWRTVDLTSSTAYAQGGKPAAAGAVKTGTYVLVAGHVAADHTTLDATAVALLGTDPAGGPGFFGPLGGGAFWPGGAAVFGGPGFLGGPPSGFHPMQPPQGAPSSAGVD